LRLIMLRTMSEKNTIIAEMYASSIKDIFEPVDEKNACVQKSDDMKSIFSHLSTKTHVWVVDDLREKHVIGIITETDTIQLFAPPYTSLQSYDIPSFQSFQYGLSMTAEELMSKQPLIVKSDEKIIKVIEIMKEQHIKQLAVVDEQERFIGEITLSRLIKEYLKRSSDIKR
jgi:predicted transcriptional regulator